MNLRVWEDLLEDFKKMASDHNGYVTAAEIVYYFMSPEQRKEEQIIKDTVKQIVK